MFVDFVTTRSAQPLPDSLYATTLDTPHVARPALHGTVETEVAIVGGGFTGLSTALALARKGTDCLLLDANLAGWGASGRNGGQINPGLKFGPDSVKRDLGEAVASFSQQAADRLFDLVDDLGIRCEIRRGGTLRAATDTASFAGLQALHAEANRQGIPYRLLSRAEMASTTGTERYVGGLLDPAGGQLNPLKLALGLARAAEAAGARICENTPVMEASEQGDGWLLSTPDGQVRARRVLFATNGYSDALVPGLRRSVIPVFSSILASNPLPQSLADRILSEGQSLFEVGLVTTYYRVDAARRLIFGGRGRMADAAGPAAFPMLETLARRLWPEIDDIGWSHGWNGRVALTRDHYPHLHRIGRTGWAFLGYNGRGVAMSTAMGPELAAILAGTDGHRPVFPEVPIRAVPFQPFWPSGVLPALAWARLRDRFARTG